MTIFTRLFILFTLFISVNSYADYWGIGNIRAGSPEELCKILTNSDKFKITEVKPVSGAGYGNRKAYADCYNQFLNDRGRMWHYTDDKCHHAGTPATILYDYGSPKPLVGCEPVSGGFCMWQIEGDMVINLSGSNQHSVIHRSKGFVTSCTPKKEGVCDPKDPYGGCYTPPDDGCTRHKDGSITCPEEKPPEIKQGCENGATYCNQPKDGCGSGYVSGTLNGKNVCVIANNSTSNNSSSDSSNSSDNSNSANNSDNSGANSNGSNNSDNSNSANNSDNSGANSNGSNNSDNSNSANNSDNSGSSGGGSTGGGKDDKNQDGEKTDNNNDKGDKTGCKDLNNCDWVKSDDFNAVFQAVDRNELEKQLGYENNPQLENDKSSLNGSIHDFSNKLTLNAGGQCISDFTVNLFGKSIVLPISEWCPVIALFKIFLHLVTFLLCLRLIHATIIRL